MKKVLIIALILFGAASVFANAPKIAFIPFTNANGDNSYDKLRYDIQDSLQKQFACTNENNIYEIVPFEQISAKLKEKKISEDDVQYDTYLWQIAEEMGVQYIISGNFLHQASKFVVNTYIYDVAMKMPITSHQAKDIFVPQDNIFLSVKPIRNRLVGFFNK